MMHKMYSMRNNVYLLTIIGKETTANLSTVMSIIYQDDMVLTVACAILASPHEKSDGNTVNHFSAQ